MSQSTTIRWGIMATGGIARTFTRDLLISPSTRSVSDIHHVVVAAASSSSISSAKSFISDLVTPVQSSPLCEAHSSYAALAKDPNVDIIYVATPHSHHFQNVMLCLENNKHVLCEKAFTVNAPQAKKLYRIAEEKKLFLMEAVWTRYFPLSIAVRKAITDGRIGEVVRVSADLSTGDIPEQEFDVANRMLNLDLAGGALLDLGVYSLTWVFQTLYHTLALEEREPPKVKGVAMMKEHRTGADEMTSVVLEFSRSSPTGARNAHALVTTAMRVAYDRAQDGSEHEVPAVRVYGEKGEIQVYGPIYRPSRMKVIEKGGRVEDRKFDFPGGGHGMFWEADEAARCWRDGKLQSDGMGWEESIAIMVVMDEIRRQGGLQYPEAIETLEYPVDLKAKGL